jgi:hypothetical protein
MSLKETVKKYTIKFFLVVISGFLLLLNAMQPAEMASLPTTSQINRMQELTPLYQAYKLELEAGTIEKILSFDNYVDRNPEYKKVYKGVNLFGRDSSNNRIEIMGEEENSNQLILYDDSTTPDLDWFKSSKRPKPVLKKIP